MKIFIYAYSKLNLGDDLFVKILCDRYPDVKFYLMASSKYSNAYKAIPNLKLIPKTRGIDRLSAAIKKGTKASFHIQSYISKRCDAIVCIGGSIFMQGKQWQAALEQFRRQIIPHIPFFIIGSNFGPFSDEEFLLRYKDAFKLPKDICFRDNYSYNLFAELRNVRKESDPVFVYSDENKVETKKRITISPVDVHRRLELSYLEDLNKVKKDYHKLILTLIGKFIEDGYKVNLMAFCIAEGDEAVCEEIFEKIKPQHSQYVDKYVYRGNIEEAVKLIKESEYVIASRFHAMILAWIFGSIAYPLIYSDKSLNVIQDMVFSGSFADIRKLEEVDADRDYKKLIESKPLEIAAEINSANKQFAELDRFIKNHG